MENKEISLEKNVLVSIFAGDIVKNPKILAEKFNTKILIRDTRIKISSNSIEDINNLQLIINKLVKLYHSGARISQKDFEAISYMSTEKNSQNLLHEDKEIIQVGNSKNAIIPRTKSQIKYVKEIQSKDITFGVGPAGTGKTYLAMANAISLFLSGKFSRIVLTRPAMEAGENLGFLPGTLEEKIKPYLRPLYDALYDMLDFESANKLIEDGIIEVAPLAFMRGRTLNNSFIILDEAQNTTIEQMLMFLTRMGFESKCVITGDPTQTDLPKDKTSGLIHASRILAEIEGISICKFTTKDVVRNSIVEKIINAYESDKKIRMR